MIAAYLRYLSRARDEHSLHSPFLFSLYTQIIRAKTGSKSAFSPIKSLRKELRRNRQSITIADFGAGSKVNSSRQRSIGDIARNSQKPARFARLLFRLIQRFEAKTIVDLGTSLGITTAYLAEATKSYGGHVTTFEGCPQTATIAQQNFERLGIGNVTAVVGNLDETLASHISALNSIDFVFFDANHRYEPTVRYFETCLSATHNDTVFVFDDIHWSDEMEQAWAYIKAHAAVTVTVDLFWVGLVFFRKEQPKQDFVLRF
ncbi:O-methyltransferase [Spirosoma endophyticum]|uniref:Methyltransferase domain-containing protein n=1 Tax=Spirosoma endophyticum TaxID=662367 RepID=A0A1I1RPX1_9BACT|nr:class I SAM-dependent methyltransferase [Spirosoma endophyticum]SFD36371.1 Methyltransferase domain-containing protein [Spirosoma endophyticum]